MPTSPLVGICIKLAKESYRKASPSKVSNSAGERLRPRITPLLFISMFDGMTSIPYSAATSLLPPAGLHSCVNERPSADTALRHSFISESSERPTTLSPLPLYFLCNASIAGNSARQGAHQLAQNCSNVYLPASTTLEKSTFLSLKSGSSKFRYCCPTAVRALFFSACKRWVA